VGDETLVLPPALKFVQYAERIRDTVHILYPYVKVDMEHNGIHYVSHEWRRDKVSVGGEGAIVLMTDGCEYRLKFVPTTEIEFDGHIYEVASAPDCFRPVRPRYGKKPKSEAEALSYLASTVSLMMVDLVVEADFCDIPPDSSQVNVVGDGDCVTVSFRNDAPQGKFLNLARVKTSAKALIQDTYGNFVLIREGTKGWDLPGGKADYVDEPPSAIIRRELREELGWECPEVKWKVIRRTPASIGFIYHLIVDKFSLPKEARWFSVDEFLATPISSMVSWLPSLLIDVLTVEDRPRAINFLASDGPHYCLQLSRPGGAFLGSVFKKFGYDSDAAGNPVTNGHYIGWCVPATARSLDLNFGYVGKVKKWHRKFFSLRHPSLQQDIGRSGNLQGVAIAIADEVERCDRSYRKLCNDFLAGSDQLDRVAYWNAPVIPHNRDVVVSRHQVVVSYRPGSVKTNRYFSDGDPNMILF
jgi:hypothetical protein